MGLQTLERMQGDQPHSSDEPTAAEPRVKSTELLKARIDGKYARNLVRRENIRLAEDMDFLIDLIRKTEIVDQLNMVENMARLRGESLGYMTMVLSVCAAKRQRAFHDTLGMNESEYILLDDTEDTDRTDATDEADAAGSEEMDNGETNSEDAGSDA
jgi:hypothetical protein